MHREELAGIQYGCLLRKGGYSWHHDLGNRLIQRAEEQSASRHNPLQPILGTTESPDGRQLVVADVPGLIEGASEGVGLGHEFLAHLERARLLLHVIDSSEADSEDRWRTIDAELAAYGAGLDTRPQVIVLNKIDLLPYVDFDLEKFGNFVKSINPTAEILPLSATTGDGTAAWHDWIELRANGDMSQRPVDKTFARE